MFEQAAIAVQDQAGYARLQARLDEAFDTRQVEVFLHRVRRAGRRIRDFEGLVEKGLLGKEAAAAYGALPVSDRGLTRERYLQLVERVAPELRQRYFKVYASY